MAVLAFTDASLVVNGVDLSDHVRSLTINYEAEAIEDTAMGDAFKSRIGGLKDWSVDVEFAQDFAANKIDATLFGIVGTVVTITIKPTSAAVSATNPSYSGPALLQSYPPLDGSVGDLATTKVKFVGAGTLTRATA